jgi:hypothetical protein
MELRSPYPKIQCSEQQTSRLLLLAHEVRAEILKQLLVFNFELPLNVSEEREHLMPKIELLSEFKRARALIAENIKVLRVCKQIYVEANPNLSAQNLTRQRQSSGAKTHQRVTPRHSG